MMGEHTHRRRWSLMSALLESAPTAFAGIRWQGHWIGPEAPAHGEDIAFGGEVEPHEFSRVLYRRTFTIGAVAASVPLRLTVDSRYVLYINDVEVGRGPIRSQPRRLRFDEYDIAPLLVAGENVIAVLVTYYGDANSYWQPAVGTGGVGRDAMLVLEAQLGDELLVSDESWRVQRSPAHSTFEHGALDGVPVENLDARLIAPDWTSTAFDDSSWATASLIATQHIGGFARTQPPTDPYGRLLPRSIAALGGEVVEPATVIDVSQLDLPPWQSEHPAERVVELLTSIDATPAAGGRFPVVASVPAGRVQHVAVDFGRIVAGYVEFDIEAPAGTVVELLYRELVWDRALGTIASAPRTGARYTTRGTDDRYRALELNGLRYIHLAIHSPGGADVTVSSPRVREYFYQRTGGAFFRSNDAELNALYTAGIRTVAMNSFDSFTDCPTREQRAWVGDGIVHQSVHLATSTDWRLARNYVTLGDSPRADGMLPMTVVGEIESGGGVTIPDWALHWVHGVHQLFLHDGDAEFMLDVLPTVEGILRWYEPYVDEFGTLSDLPEWNLIDWSSVFSTGRTSIATALWARGLREFAELSEFVGNTGSARWARDRWEAARVGFEDFWDDTRGTYVDHFLDGVRQPAASQAAGATAIVSGLAPKERWSRIIDTVTDDATLVVRSWIGGNDGGYDPQKIQDQAAGIQRIDWDAEREVVIAEPFYSYVVHDAVAASGQAGKLTHLVRRWSQFLVNGYDTFGECWGWGTPVHGWSSTPTRDLVSYVLGVTPAEPGFAKVRVNPQLGSLTTVEGAVPTPHGLVTVTVTDATVTIDSPVPVLFGDTELAPGHHEVRR